VEEGPAKLETNPVEPDTRVATPAPDENPSLKRRDREIAAGKHPVEPHMEVMNRHKTGDALRDFARFAIISRCLFQNRKNTEIISQLNEAGHMLSVRTLQRLMDRSDFQEYYDNYRAQVLGPVDKIIRDNWKLSMPEAQLKIISLMRSSRSEKVQFDSAVTVLEGGDGLKKESIQKKFIINVPPEIQKALYHDGKRFDDDAPNLLPEKTE